MKSVFLLSSALALLTLVASRSSALPPVQLADRPTTIPAFPSVRGITFNNVPLTAPETRRDAKLEAAIAGKDYRPIGEWGDRYFYNRVDLNDDGVPEVIVYPLGSYFCGSGGCTLIIFQTVGQTYREIGRFPVTRQPLVVTNQKNNGWRTLVRLTSGGGAPANYSYLRYVNGQYDYGDDVPAKTAVTGRAFFSNQLQFEDGLPLRPAK